MGMTDSQFKTFVRLVLNLVGRALKEAPESENLKELQEILQQSLED